MSVTDQLGYACAVGRFQSEGYHTVRAAYKSSMYLIRSWTTHLLEDDLVLLIVCEAASLDPGKVMVFVMVFLLYNQRWLV